MENKKINNLTVCIVCGVLTAFGLVASIISQFKLIKVNKIADMIDIILALLICYYAILGYKKPHGNLLKYVILLFASIFLNRVYLSATRGDAWQAVMNACIIALCFYIAGRLHKVKQNIILMGIVLAIIVIAIIERFVVDAPPIGIFTNIIYWLDICAAYFLRYKDHKEAGLMDAPKN